MMTKACPMHSQVVDVDVDESNNGRGCGTVGNEDQSTQAQFANNNNAKNNVIENCNSSSSSSYSSFT